MNVDLSMTLFEFDMRSIEIEKEMLKDIVLDRYNTIIGNDVLTESVIETISDFLVKIFDSICELIEKAVMNLRKKFQSIKFDKAKKRIEAIRKSDKEPSDCNFKLKIPKAELMKGETLTDLNLNIIGFERNRNTIFINKDTFFMKAMIEYEKRGQRKAYADGFAEGWIFTLCNTNEKLSDYSSFNDAINSVSEIEINKSNCRNKMSEVESLYDTIEKFINSEFKKCIDVLIKIKQESRKMTIYAKTHEVRSSLFGTKDKESTMLMRMAAYEYSKAVKFAISYLFGTTSFYLKCLNENISNMSNALL